MNEIVKAGENIFMELGIPAHEAGVLKMRAEMMVVLRTWLEGNGLTQVESAARLGITQGRISDLVCGKWQKFSLDMLIRLALRAGIQIELKLAA
jgi:predicted XRE-type DNA-binding protein